MVVNRREMVAGSRVVIMDDVIPLDFLDNLRQEIKGGGWSINDSIAFNSAKSPSDDWTDNVPFIKCLDHVAFAERILWKNLENIVRTEFATESLIPYDVSYNSGRPGDSPWEHQDGFTPGVTDITLIAYMNATWDKNWAGETVYYDGEDIALSVLPKPGRMVVHDAMVNHAARPPTIAMEENMRFTLAIKCTDSRKYYEERMKQEREMQ